jgi:Domain of unknown function (DUF4272)
MMNFVGQIEAQNPKVKHKLMVKIQRTKASIGFVSDSLIDFEENLFGLILSTDSYAFVDGTSWLDGNKKLILATSGISELDDLNIPDADIKLGQAEMDSPESLYPSQIQRKERTIQFLKTQNIPTIAHLPCIEADEEVSIRTVEEVVKRTLAVAIAAIKGEGLEDAIVRRVIKQFEAESFFSKEELEFIQKTEITDNDKVKFSWRYECLWVLLWSLGYIKELNSPTTICDVATAVGFIRDSETYSKMLSESNLRTKAEILDEADLIYRMNWACVNARIKNQAAPASLDGGVVHERYYALNWLINSMNEDWDNISTHS